MVFLSKFYYQCDGLAATCDDGSDEDPAFCNNCTEEGYLPCPGFPGNCGKLCDGNATCPDYWDELLLTCKSDSGSDQSKKTDSTICSEEAGLFQCRDGSM